MIIGLSGYAGSGKDTVANMLLDSHEYTNRSFAAPMKDAMYALSPVVTIDGSRLHEVVDREGWESAKRNYPEVRRLLQVFGTEVGRQMFGQDFWVEQAFRGVSSSQLIVFTDVRFTNEADYIKTFMGEIWRVNRPGYHPTNSHPSESAMDDWKFDRVIVNDSGLDSLREQVDAFVADALPKYQQRKLANVL